MKISVIMPTARDSFGSAHYKSSETHLFEPTVNSLQRQNFKDFEFIVCDLLHPYRKDYFENKNLDFPVKHVPVKPNPWKKKGLWQVCAQLNTCLTFAEGELIVRIDDCCEFNPDYLEKIWSWYRRGKWSLSLFIRYLKGKPCARQDYIKLLPHGGKTPEDMKRTKEAVLKFFNKGDTIKDTRFKFVEEGSGIYAAPPGWVYGYFSAPLEALLRVNGFDERFDGSKSLEDCDIGIRLGMAGYKAKFILVKNLVVIEHEHGSCSRKVLFGKGKPPKCNHALMLLNQKNNWWRANIHRLSEEQLNFVKEESSRKPCSHVSGRDYDFGDVFTYWSTHQPIFDLN